MAKPIQIDSEELSILLCLVGIEATPQEIAGWTVEQRASAATWAAKEHLSASDNPVRRVPKPDFLPRPWAHLPFESD